MRKLTWLSCIVLFGFVMSIQAQEAVDSLGDVLPDGAVQRLGTRRMCYGHWLAGMEYLSDSTALVLNRGTLDIWDLEKAEITEQQNVTDGSLVCVDRNSDGQTLLLGDSKGRVIEWNVADGVELRRWETPQKSIKSAQYSPDETCMLVAGSSPMGCVEMELSSGKVTASVDADFVTTRCGAIYGPDGDTAIMGGGHDHLLEYWNLRTGELLGTWATNYECKDLHLSADGKRVAIGVEAYAEEWNLADFSRVRPYDHTPGEAGRVYTLRYLQEGNNLLCAGRDGGMYRWNCETGEQVRAWRPHQSVIYEMAVSPDEKWVLSYADGRLMETSTETGQSRLEWNRHDGAVTCAAFCPDGVSVASGSADGTVRVWDIEHGTTLCSMDVCPVGVYALAVSPDGQRVAAGGKDGVVREYSLAEGALLRTLEGHLGFVRSLAYTHSGDRLLSTADDGTLRIWRDGDAAPRMLREHLGGVLAVDVSPDDTRVVTGGRDGIVRIWDMATGSVVSAFEGHRGWVDAVRFVGSGRYVVSYGRDARVLRWNLERGKLVSDIPCAGWGRAVACSPDGMRAYCAGDSAKLTICDLPEAQITDELAGHVRGITCLAVSPDGSRVVTGSLDSTLLVWKVGE